MHNSVLNLALCVHNNNAVIAGVLLAARVSRARGRKPLKVESNLCVTHERGNVTLAYSTATAHCPFHSALSLSPTCVHGQRIASHPILYTYIRFPTWKLNFVHLYRRWTVRKKKKSYSLRICCMRAVIWGETEQKKKKYKNNQNKTMGKKIVHTHTGNWCWKSINGLPPACVYFLTYMYCSYRLHRHIACASG